MPSWVSLPTGRDASAHARSRVGLGAVLLVACACSRGPARPTRVAPESSPSARSDAAAAHLARGEEARDRDEYDLARQEAEKARDLFEKDGDWEGYVRARNLLGGVESRRGDYKTAREELDATLAVAREKLGPDHPEVARSYYEIGNVDVSTGRPKEGLELLEKALALRRAAGGARTKEVGEILLRMGLAHTDQGEDERALALVGEAEAIARALPGQPQLEKALIGKGIALWGLARYDPAIEVLQEAVRILETGKSRRAATLASAYANLGTAYWSKSDYDEALVYYEKALPLEVARDGEAHPDVGLLYFNLATLHLMKRDYDGCIASAERALKILVPALGERSSVVVQTYNALGSALTRKGESDKGLGVLEKALAIQLSLPEKGSRDSAVIYSSLADAYRAKHDLIRAERDFREALAIDVRIHGRRHPDVAEDYVNLGDLHLEEGQEAEALRFFGTAITTNQPQAPEAEPDLEPPLDTAFSEEYLLKALRGAARARARLGAKKADRRQVEAAALVYDHASRLIDRMRAGYRAEGSKLQIAESATAIYDEAIASELELHRLTSDERHLEKAFGFAEKSKVGILRDALNEAEARSYSGIPRQVLDRERQLRIDLTAVDQRLTDAQLDTGAEEGRLQPLGEKKFALKREYEALQQRLEKEYPAYYDLKYRFDTASPTQIQAGLLDEGTVLVEYFLGQKQVFVFTVTRQDVAVAVVERETSLEGDLSELRRAIGGRSAASSGASASRLYRQLLAPVEDRIAGRTLVVVPDGALSTVPFEALLEHEVGPDTEPRELPYVLRDHAVSYAYSATLALQEIHRRGVEPPDDFVGFAPLVSTGVAPDLPALPASEREVTAVRELFARRRGFVAELFKTRSRTYLGGQATEGRLKSTGLERYRYVHVATHGIVDEDHPGRSRLLLAPEPGAGEDGVLRLGEAFDLHLNADLVVLSACDTGRGRIARGEGIIGFTRGFLYAGAQSLLVSLWPVSDAASSELVIDFYRELLGGRPKAEALRQAKLRAMARNPEYAKPYYWSSLVLVGGRR